MGLLRGMARTAVVAGTASAVSGRVQRRQANKFAEKDAATAAKQQEAYDAQMAQQQPPPPTYQQPVTSSRRPLPGRPGGIRDEALEQLKQLGALKDKGFSPKKSSRPRKRRSSACNATRPEGKGSVRRRFPSLCHGKHLGTRTIYGAMIDEARRGDVDPDRQAVPRPQRLPAEPTLPWSVE